MTTIDAPPVNNAPPKFKEANLGKWCMNRQGMEVEYQLLRALNGGTKAMREMGTALLPMDWREREVTADYQARVNRTALYPAYSEAVDQIASRPFQKAVELKDPDNKLPVLLQKLETNADRNGTDLTAFARDLLTQIVDRGLGLFIVDNPPTPTTVPDGIGGTREPKAPDEDALDLRPYFLRVSADNLIDWAWKKEPGGRDVLAYIQLFDEMSRTDPVTGDDQTVQRIRFWSDTEWQVWERTVPAAVAINGAAIDSPDLTTRSRLAWQRSINNVKQQGAQYLMTSQGPHALGEVPLVSINVNQYGPDRLTARPPLQNLAHLNVAHWQSTSQQANILHYTRAPILQGKGVPQDIADGTKQVVLGAGAKMFSTSNDFALSYVSPNGDGAMTAGAEDLKALEDKMSKLGMQPLILPVTTPQTALGVAVDETRTQAKAQSWVEAAEWGLYRGYELAAKWLGEKLPENFDVALWRDIGIQARSQQDLDALNKARDRKDIARQPYLQALKIRGVLSADFDVVANDEMLQEEQDAEMQNFTAQAEEQARIAAETQAAMPPEAPQPPPGTKKAPKAKAAA